MSSDCSFEKHILSVSSRCSRLAGWILRTFASRDKITMLTLFKSLVLSRLDYGSQLWSPFKAKDIRLLVSTSNETNFRGNLPLLNTMLQYYINCTSIL